MEEIRSELKERFEKFITEECGDSLWGDNGTDDYDTAYDVKDKVWNYISQELDRAREEGYKKGYIDGQIEKINKPKPVVSEFDKTSYLN